MSAATRPAGCSRLSSVSARQPSHKARPPGGDGQCGSASWRRSVGVRAGMAAYSLFTTRHWVHVIGAIRIPARRAPLHRRGRLRLAARWLGQKMLQCLAPPQCQGPRRQRCWRGRRKRRVVPLSAVRHAGQVVGVAVWARTVRWRLCRPVRAPRKTRWWSRYRRRRWCRSRIGVTCKAA